MDGGYSNSYISVDCGIIEEEDESVPVNLRDKKIHFDYEDYGDYQDTSLCWTMAERYNDRMLLHYTIKY